MGCTNPFSDSILTVPDIGRAITPNKMNLIWHCENAILILFSSYGNRKWKWIDQPRFYLDRLRNKSEISGELRSCATNRLEEKCPLHIFIYDMGSGVWILLMANVFLIHLWQLISFEGAVSPTSPPSLSLSLSLFIYLSTLILTVCQLI